MEVWKPIPQNNSYGYVSNYGRVRSCKGMLRKTFVSNNGYERVGFAGGKKTIAVHKLVAIVFCDGYKEGLQVNHKDGNKLNNCHTNLEWVTSSDNIKHSFRTGLKKPVKSNIVIADEEFEKIVYRVAAGEKQRAIAKEYGVTPGAICKRIKDWKRAEICLN